MKIIYKLIVLISFIGLEKNANAQATSDLMWSSGILVFDIENLTVPSLEIGMGVLFFDISDLQSLSLDASPSLWFNYNTTYGFLSFVNVPLMVNYNLGHRLTNNYDVDSPIGLFAGAGYEYSYNGFAEIPSTIHGPSAQFGVRFQFWDRGGSYYAKLRVHQPISNPKYDYPVISIGIGQNL